MCSSDPVADSLILLPKEKKKTAEETEVLF